jgi:hypothetical protein
VLKRSACPSRSTAGDLYAAPNRACGFGRPRERMSRPCGRPRWTTDSSADRECWSSTDLGPPVSLSLLHRSRTETEADCAPRDFWISSNSQSWSRRRTRSLLNACGGGRGRPPATVEALLDRRVLPTVSCVARWRQSPSRPSRGQLPCARKGSPRGPTRARSHRPCRRLSSAPWRASRRRHSDGRSAVRGPR